MTDFPDTEQTVADFPYTGHLQPDYPCPDNPPTNNTVFKNTVSRNTELNNSKEEEEEDVDARAYIDLDAFSRKLMNPFMKSQERNQLHVRTDTAIC